MIFVPHKNRGKMANKSISMVQVRRIIQLKAEGASKYSISKTLGMHRTTLEGYLRKLESTGKSYQILLEHSDQELVDIVYNTSNTYQPDGRFRELEKQFKCFLNQLKYPGVTRKTLWEEYKESYPEGYEYTQFCEHFARYLVRTKATMHFDHRPGEYLQVDFAGKPLHIVCFEPVRGIFWWCNPQYS